jgi:hypothetical protein
MSVSCPQNPTFPERTWSMQKTWMLCGLMYSAVACSDGHGDARKYKPEIKK